MQQTHVAKKETFKANFLDLGRFLYHNTKDKIDGFRRNQEKFHLLQKRLTKKSMASS
jgi:hypothetical protein